ncbi:ester cyclase [Cellulosimicrobium cellulans]|uniref:ester cyclase n=1 Tax=Cellulosimicrobium cellulans TaxID=1710 RepID=UPI002096A4C7|nr:ester cyclase [Cellulosimicrobium cellulans]MCO7274795.1 ester cyclase [Cellulosimicrobium cellulans]
MTTRTPADLVREFFAVVRSGDDPARAGEYFAPLVAAHQVTSEAPTTVHRTPAQYAEHVEEMRAAYGRFTLTVDELLADGDRVYVRWTQRGRHVGEVDGRAPTGAEVVQVASCVYRVADDRVVEYWMQIDRAGLAAQLAAATDPAGPSAAGATMVR